MARYFKNKVTEHNYYVKMLNRNLARLEQKMPESRALERYRGEFVEITSKNPNKRKVAEALKKVRDIYKSGVTSLSSERRSVALSIDTLKRNGINYVNKKNFKSFFNFLDDARARGLGALYSSTQLIEAFKEAKKKKLTKTQILANIDYWANKYIKYDEDGLIEEPDMVKPIKVITGKRLNKYMEKMKARIKKEAKGDY